MSEPCRLRDDPLDIAIIGGGIAGLSLALGLLTRNVNFRIYERTRSFREIGAGIGFSPNAERAMKIIDPRIHAAFKKVATPNMSDWFYWVDGHSEKGDDARLTEDEYIFKLYLGERGFEGCHRADFLDELVKSIPADRIGFQKRLSQIVDRGDGEKLLLEFHDGTEAQADLVIGCDGIRSRVRQLVLGEDNPASYPHYSHKYAIRGLIPTDKAKAALGDYKPTERVMRLGPDAHALTFPVAGGSFVNVVAFVHDPEDWPEPDKLTAPANKGEAAAAFNRFGPTVRAIMDLLPEKLDKWAVFDTFDHPATTYRKGRICIAGDAAHAAAPYHGAGAGFGIEDAAVLCALMPAASATIRESGASKAEIIHVALAAYDAVRRERAQWLVESSRRIGEIYQWRDVEVGRDNNKCRHEAEWRAHAIWDYDVDAMIRETREEYSQRLPDSVKN